MAVDMNAERESTNEKPFQILCSSRRKVDEGLERMDSTIKELVDKNIVWTSEEKDKVRRLFQKVYTETIHENVSIDGKRWKDDDTEECTTEFEPVNRERQQYMSVIEDQYQDALVNMAKKRKHCPYQCVQQLAKEVKANHIQLIKSKPTIESQLPTEVIDVNDTQFKEQLQTAKLTSEKCQSLMQRLPQVVEEADNLYSALMMRSMMGTTDTDDVIYNKMSPLPKHKRSSQNLEEEPSQDPETPSAVEALSPLKAKRQRRSRETIRKKGAILRGEK